MSALIKSCETAGLTWIIPFLRLARRENPSEQVRQILIQIGVPILAMAVFLGLWSTVPARVKVSFGELPGPVAVWTEDKRAVKVDVAGIVFLRPPVSTVVIVLVLDNEALRRWVLV